MSRAISKRRKLIFAAVGLACLNLLCFGAGWFGGRLTAGAAQVDLGVVRDQVAAPAFFELLFEQSPVEGFHKALVPDPFTKVRPRPLHPAWSNCGPHDLLGFRGLGLPARVDIVTIGDSQTYGWGVPLAENWPSLLGAATGRDVYNMALGGWGGAQYRYMAAKAVRLAPKQLVVGLYMGNDSIESLRWVYLSDEFAEFRLPGKSDLDAFDLRFERRDPVVAAFPDGEMQFTPDRRLFVNDRRSDAVRAGYQILAATASALASEAREAGVPTTFVLIPTKESVYWPLLQREAVEFGPDFQRLVGDEAQNARELGAGLTDAGFHVVNALEPLQQAVLGGADAYPQRDDGHPLKAGYEVIAAVVAGALDGREDGPK